MIRCVVFDFDGTLVDSNGIKRQGFFDIASVHPNGTRHMVDALNAVNAHRSAVFRDYAERMSHSGISLDFEVLTQIYSQQVDERVAMAQEISGASQLLERLRLRGLKIHLSSSTPKDNLKSILHRRGWLDRFDAVHGLPEEKPASLRNILRSEGILAEQVVVVGDGQDDAEAAETVGCLFIAVGAGTLVSLKRGDQPIGLSEVEARLQRFSGAERYK